MPPPHILKNRFVQCLSILHVEIEKSSYLVNYSQRGRFNFSTLEKNFILYYYLSVYKRGAGMKTKMFGIVLTICLVLSTVLNAQVMGIQWNTFAGSMNWDRGTGIATDGAGNIYIVGYCSDAWGSPINGHPGGHATFMAKFDGNANLVWNTFMGSGNFDYGFDIAMDESGNIYITGYSFATWGTPLNAHAGSTDVFVAKLDNNGNLLWNTFLGCSSADSGESITVTNTGTIYVTGLSPATWGTPLNPYTGSDDAFVAKLDTNGGLVWNTFLGSSSGDLGYGIALDGSENVFVTGSSYATWGTPINAHAGDNDVFVAKLSSAGALTWNTFLGSSSADMGYGITIDFGGSAIVTGFSNATWGTPLNPYTGSDDVFVAKIEPDGVLIWNTFMGGSQNDYGRGVATDPAGNIYVTGYCNSGWGNPINPHAGDWDMVVARLDLDGNRWWHTFLGSSEEDRARGISIYDWENIFVVGFSSASWGSPENAYAGDDDAVIVKIVPYPIPDIKANGSDGPVSISQTDSLQIRISLMSYGLTNDVDFWLAYKGPSGWVHYNKATKSWESGLGVTHQGILFDLNNKKVFQSSGLAPGNYTFYFGVDLNMDGKVTKSSLYKDEVQVTVTQ
jgi:hypothetical protein